MVFVSFAFAGCLCTDAGSTAAANGASSEFTVGMDANNNPVKVRIAPGNLYKQGDTYNFDTTICYNKGDENTSKCYFTWDEAMNGSANDKSGTYSVDGYGDGWKMLTDAQWNYLVKNSKHASAKINGITGMIIAPDGCTLSPEYSTWDNDDECTNWPDLQAAGCIFLPSTGLFVDGNVIGTGGSGRYWSSSRGNSDEGGTMGEGTSTYESNVCSWHLFFMEQGAAMLNGNNAEGYSVRLVQDVQ